MSYWIKWAVFSGIVGVNLAWAGLVVPDVRAVVLIIVINLAYLVLR